MLRCSVATYIYLFDRVNFTHVTIFSCGAVVYRKVEDRPQFLLIQQRADDPRWGIPKGKMSLGETYTETAARETFEEAGVDIRIITQLPHVVITRGKQRKIVVPFLATQVCDREPSSDHLESEVADARWFDVDSLPPLYSYQQPIFDAALLLLKQ